MTATDHPAPAAAAPPARNGSRTAAIVVAGVMAALSLATFAARRRRALGRRPARRRGLLLDRHPPLHGLDLGAHDRGHRLNGDVPSWVAGDDDSTASCACGGVP